MEVQNPYVVGNPVGYTDAFVGRFYIFDDILNMIHHKTDNGIVIFGQRRAGKTSILHRLKRVLEEEHEEAKPVFIDLMGKCILCLDDVLSDLAFEISDSLGVERPQKAQIHSRNFIPWVKSIINSQDKKLVLLFDEFDVLNDEQKGMAGEKLFAYLNRLFNIDLEKVKVVIAVGRDILDLYNLLGILVKNFSVIKISVLNKPYAIEIIKRSEKVKYGNLVWTRQAVDAILELTNGHSYLTQQLCSSIWYNIFKKRKKPKRRIFSTDVHDSIADAMSHSQGALEWIWDGLSPVQRIIVAALASEMTSAAISEERLQEILDRIGVRAWMDRLENDPKDKFFTDELVIWDILEYNSQKKGYFFKVEFFRRWVCENKSIARAFDELDRIDERAHDLFRRARKFFEKKDIGEAYKFVCKALDRNPNHLEGIKLKARIYIVKGEEEKAVDELRRLRDFLPDEAEPYLVQALLALARKIDNEDERLKIFNEVLELRPENKTALTAKRKIFEARGDNALKYGDFEAAIESYSDADLADKVAETERLKVLSEKLEYLDKMKQVENYQEVLNVLESLKRDYPEEGDWQLQITEYKRKNIVDVEIYPILEKMKSENPELLNISLVDVIGNYSLIYPSRDPVSLEIVEFTRDLFVGLEELNETDEEMDFNWIFFETIAGKIWVVRLNHSFLLTVLSADDMFLSIIISGFHEILEDLSEKINSIFS